MNCGEEGVGGKKMERKKEEERDYVISSYNNIIFFPILSDYLGYMRQILLVHIILVVCLAEVIDN